MGQERVSARLAESAKRARSGLGGRKCCRQIALSPTWPEWFLPLLSVLKRLLCQNIQRQLVGLAVEVFEQGIFEDGVVGGSGQKQGHAGPEFEIVGISEDLVSAATVHIEDKLRTGSEPGT